MKAKTLQNSARCVTPRSANNDSTPKVAKSTMVRTLAILLFILLGVSCNREINEGGEQPDTDLTTGLFVINEGNYMAGNASLAFFDYKSQKAQQNLFSGANNAPLGDVPTQMVVWNNRGYITLSNSGKIYIVDPLTCKLLGKITGLNSPRYIQFISSTKAYVTNVMSPMIDIIDPTALTITGHIALKSGHFAEQMVEHDGFVYTNLWSYGKQILKIDLKTDSIVDSLEVGIQPQCLYKDADNNLWTLADGGYDGNPIGFTDAQIVCIDIQNFKVKKSFTILRNEATKMYRLMIAVDGRSIYYINQHLYKMDVDAVTSPTIPFINSAANENFYSIGIDPNTNDIFIADALDYTQEGKIYHYNSSGEIQGSFKAGIIPGSFCFVRK